MSLLRRPTGHRASGWVRGARHERILSHEPGGRSHAVRDGLAVKVRWGHAFLFAAQRNKYTLPSRDPTATSPLGPMAGEELTAACVANDQRSVPAEDTA
jgi:hypothetical protein